MEYSNEKNTLECEILSKESEKKIKTGELKVKENFTCKYFVAKRSCLNS